MAAKRKSLFFFLLRNALIVAIVGGGAYYAFTVIKRERAVADRLNQAAAAVTAGDYPKAVQTYESVLTGLKPGKDDGRIDRIKHSIARSQLAWAEDASLPITESLKHYQAAEKMMPGCVKDPQILKLLKQRALLNE